MFVAAFTSIITATASLKRYEHVTPARLGFSMRGIREEDLRKGKPIARRLPGARPRLMSVQDIHAPERVIWDTIMAVERYPQMVDGCISTQIYSRRATPTGGRRVKAKYRIRIPPRFTLEYNVKHDFEPLKHSMCFSLDHSRRNQLIDMVGYWHVHQLGKGDDVWSRVYCAQARFEGTTASCVSSLLTAARSHPA